MVARTAKTRTGKTDPGGTADATTPTDAVQSDVVAAQGGGSDTPLSDPDLPVTTALDPGPDVNDLAWVDSAMILEPDRLPEPEPVPEPAPEPAPVTNPLPPPAAPRAAPLAVTPKVTVQRVGFVPLVLGGIVAAGLGFGAAYIWQRDATAAQRADLAAQSDQIAALALQVAALPAPADPAPVLARLDAADTAFAALQSDIAATLTGLDSRLTEVEKAPNGDGTLSDTAIAAWQRELEDLRAEIGTQQARMQDLANAATVQLDQTRVEAAAIEQNATDAAAAATARAALARVQAALDSGVPFEAALAELRLAADVPTALSDLAADGVPTITALQTDFPAAARAALAVARIEGLAGEEGGGFGAFLRNQFDVRSVTPQDGETADAILSRAEDALRQNRLSDAMAEVAALPEVVRAEMADWTQAAESRAAALAAADALSLSLTEN